MEIQEITWPLDKMFWTIFRPFVLSVVANYSPELILFILLKL